MNTLQTTCWTLIDEAALGDCEHRQEFANRYYTVVRTYYGTRWRGTPLRGDVEDACQEVFAECFRSNGPLTRADRKRAGGFRAFLYGIARNVAQRVEERRARAGAVALDAVGELTANETSLSQAFDRAWAVVIMKLAADRQAEVAKETGVGAQKRVELLKLRFRDSVPIREIARRWGEDATRLHREYSKARKEFLMSLREIVADECGLDSAAAIDERCRELVGALA